MKKFVPALGIISIVVAIGISIFRDRVVDASQEKSLTQEQGIALFQEAEIRDIQLLERIVTIEKKLKITPPKDSIRLVKKEK